MTAATPSRDALANALHVAVQDQGVRCLGQRCVRLAESLLGETLNADDLRSAAALMRHASDPRWAAVSDWLNRVSQDVTLDNYDQDEHAAAATVAAAWLHRGGWPPVSARILVTGSRDWTDRQAVADALSEAWHFLGRPRDAVLVQGECHLGGADQIAAETWRAWGYPVEGHPAEMGPNGHVLGPKRNAEMVALGADICLAFPLPSSRGTKNCMRLAGEAGIPVRVYRPRP